MHKIKILLIPVLIIFVWLIYSPVLKNDFVNYDDPSYISQNVYIKDCSWKNTEKIFSTRISDLYVPLVFVSYSIEYKYAQLKPEVYHTVNLLLHILNCLLVLWLVWLLFGNYFAALFISLLFAVHPLHVESVAWATELKDVLYAFFYLSAIIAYHFYCKTKKITYLVLVYLFFLLSCFSKPMAITLPVILTLYDFYYLKTRSWKIIINKLLMFLVSAAFIFVLFKIMDVSHRGAFNKEYNSLDAFYTACYGLFFYLQKSILPFHLSVVYPYPDKIGNCLPFIYYLSPFIIALIFWAVFFWKKSNEFIRVSFLFFIVAIFPVLQIIPNVSTVAADRYFYIPSLGLFSIFSFLIFKGMKNKSLKNGLLIIVSIILIVYSYQTYNRCKVWKNSITLFTDVTDQFQNSDVAYGNLGLAYNEKGDFKTAVPLLQKSIAINGSYPEMLNNYGWALSMTGEKGLAIEQFKKALSQDPTSVKTYNNLANTYGSIKQYDFAIQNFEKVLQLEPDNTTALYNLAYTYLLTDDKVKALYYYRKSARLGFDPAQQFLIKNGQNW